jgi:hypothetical protein
MNMMIECLPKIAAEVRFRSLIISSYHKASLVFSVFSFSRFLVFSFF